MRALILSQLFLGTVEPAFSLCETDFMKLGYVILYFCESSDVLMALSLTLLIHRDIKSIKLFTELLSLQKRSFCKLS